MGTGIPPLADGFIVNAIALLTEDAVSLGTQQQQWGLYDQSGNLVITADSVVSFESKQDYRIADYQVEQGGFESYNKVQVPFDVRLRFSQGGSIADRQAVQAQVDAALASIDLFDAVTPTKVYLSVNPVHQSVRHTSTDGVGLLIIDLFCQQVRVTTTTQFTTTDTTTSSPQTASASDVGPFTAQDRINNGFAAINDPQSPSAAPQTANGTVQTVAPTTAQQTQISGLLAGGAA